MALASSLSGRAADFDYSGGFDGARTEASLTPPALRVVYVVPLGPAAKAGVLANDSIIMIDGVSVRNLSSEQKREALRGAIGRVVKITLQRGDALPQEVDITLLSFPDSLLPAAYNGDAKSAELLGGFYEFGPPSSRDPKQALYWYTKAANLDGDVAEFEIGIMYLTGNGVIKDQKTAAEWFRKSAHHAYAPAEYQLGRMYDEGVGVEQSHYSAVPWLMVAASQGHGQAEQWLGWHYLYGVGVTKNDAAALKWLQAAAMQDNASAEQLLAEMYLRGYGVEKSDVDAFKWDYRAAQQDDDKAEYELAYSYDTGRGVTKDERASFAWNYRAALRGNPYAAWELSNWYETGWTVPRNPSEAFRWIRVAQAGLPENPKVQRSAAMRSIEAFVESRDFATVDVSLILAAFHREIVIAFAVLAFIYLAMGMSLLGFGLATTHYPPRLWQSFAWATFYMESQFVALFAIFLFGRVLSADLLFTAIVVLGALPLVISSAGKTRRQFWRLPSASLKAVLLSAAGGYVFFVAVAFGYNELYRAITGVSLPSQPTMALISKAKDASPWATYLCISLMLPAAEEVLFRGYFFDALRRRFSGAFVIVATALGFSLFHFQGLYILPLFALGLVLGWLKSRTDSLIPGLAIHVLNNALMLAFGV